MNHVLVDYENVQEIDLPADRDIALSLVLLVGEKQKQLKTDLVEQLLPRAAQVQLIRMTASGKNALDFALAYHLGRAVTTDPTGYFHIVSKDKGFDALVSQLKSQGFRIGRHDAFSNLPFLRLPKPAENGTTPPRDKDEVCVENLRTHPTNRPKTLRKLIAYLKTHFGGDVTDSAVKTKLDLLSRKHGISVDAKGAVIYPATWPA